MQYSQHRQPEANLLWTSYTGLSNCGWPSLIRDLAMCRGLGGWAFGREIYQPQTPRDRKQRKVLKILIRVSMQILSCLNTLETFWTHWLLEPAWRWICRSHDYLLPSELGLMDFEQQKKCWFFWSSPLCEIFLHIVVGEIPGWRALWPTPSKTAVFEASIWNCGF